MVGWGIYYSYTGVSDFVPTTLLCLTVKESGRSCGFKLEFYSSNSGLTPAWGNQRKKPDQKSMPKNELGFQGIPKICKVTLTIFGYIMDMFFSDIIILCFLIVQSDIF